MEINCLAYGLITVEDVVREERKEWLKAGQQCARGKIRKGGILR